MVFGPTPGNSLAALPLVIGKGHAAIDRIAMLRPATLYIVFEAIARFRKSTITKLA